MKVGPMAAMAAAIMLSSPAWSAQPASGTGKAVPIAASATAAEAKLMSLDEVKKQPHGPLARVVLDFLTVMDRVVNRDKQPAITAADWAPLGQYVDQAKFRRVGNYGVRNDWTSYTGLLAQWANHSWWKGYVWRIREVPAAGGRPGLVYLETEERSNSKHPVKDDGDYSRLASIAVYEFGPDNKITDLRVYDQRPLNKK